MYFQIDNTPEHIRRARRVEVVQKESLKEECPRLILAPFTRPPQVVFDNVIIGTTCEKNLEVYNPSKLPQQITLGRGLPPGLVIHLPGEWMFLEPETCYMITLMWSPTQPTALRETIRFTNENRGRYDVIVLLNSAMNVKAKNNNAKGFKVSPGKIKRKPTKISPSSIYKKKSEIVYHTTKVKQSIDIVKTTQYTEHKIVKSSNKENLRKYECLESQYKCPFDSPSSIDLNFNTSEIFSNMRRSTSNRIMQDTFDKSQILRGNDKHDNILTDIKNNVLKHSNKQNVSASDVFDNLTFTPLKLQAKNEKLDKGPKIILSMNSESDFDDSLDMKSSNKENETHSIICITSSQPSNKWLTVNYNSHIENQCTETPILPSKKIPNTSSPKELNSPNFSINTEFSRISDLSFFPQRCSTERKIFPKINNETHEIIDATNSKLSSDTYTKDSPNTPREIYMQIGQEHKNEFLREQNAKMCRQSLFKDCQRQNEINLNNFLPHQEHHQHWNNENKVDLRSPPRSLTPPLQSIPEESYQFSDTNLLDKTEKRTTFAVNRTYDKSAAWNSASHPKRQSWSKRSIKTDPGLWKMPVPLSTKNFKSKTTSKNKESLSGKNNSIVNFTKSMTQNISLNQIGNVYSQSFTVDPFLSSTYFYDEAAVENFETEFKRWLNYILTPPAELDSNIEQKIDVGKAWIENRNKEVPAAPTKEQVSSNYHNSHRLESLRRQARALLLSPEMSQVFLKLNVQIEKKLIAIRADRNLHLDVGLQKTIMELLLSYNPLWLRIGLEATYGLVLPLKSNNDIEGITTFIIQRMFRNPHLKNKHSKSSAPNMLLPAYMDAIKKFTLKKFFMLVFFLDQAKQKKLISHDPCLFCRSAICKESREIIIRFTRELIAGIGDITKHLRPLGYIVSHKQSYLDEYKYAVHNIAVDIKDGVRLTKVMEIILMKHGLMSQLRTPAISRLQKIHNVQVALQALKEANFAIVGDITATDIADGHREKTLSLLWQIIHVFRAPLFEKAANVIQVWWRKKFEVIIEKRKEEEKILKMRNNAASILQLWWRRIQYNRMVEIRMKEVSIATITIQKYFRMWHCRSRMLRLKSSVIKIENWYKDLKLMREAKKRLNILKLKRLELTCKSAIIIQSYIRRWICTRQYKQKLYNIVLLQKIIRGSIVRKRYLKILFYIRYVQQKYRGKLLMKEEMKKLMTIRKSAVTIQSYYKMWKQRSIFLKLKKSVKIIEERYLALLKMRVERNKYLKLKSTAIKIEAMFRCKMIRSKYLRQRDAIIKIQRKVRAQQAMLKVRSQYMKKINATIKLQKHLRSYLVAKKIRCNYLNLRANTIIIQRFFRSYLFSKFERKRYIELKVAAVVLQRRYRSLLLMRQLRTDFLKLRNAAVVIQNRFRALRSMRDCKGSLQKLRMATISIQTRYRALIKMREQKLKYLQWKSSCIIIQNSFRAYRLQMATRQHYLLQKQAVVKLQTWFRAHKKGKLQRQIYERLKRATITIQRRFRAYIMARNQRHTYLRMKTATIYIQKYYGCYIKTKVTRRQYIQLKKSARIIQRFFRSYLETKKLRNTFLHIKMATCKIQCYYRSFKETKKIRDEYQGLKRATLTIQTNYRALLAMRYDRQTYLYLRQSVLIIQRRYRDLINMRIQRRAYLKLRSVTRIVQQRWKANILMRKEKSKYLRLRQACFSIQTLYRAYRKGIVQRKNYLQLKQSSIKLQNRFRAQLAMKKERNSYLTLKAAVKILQRRYRAHCLMITERSKYLRILQAVLTIQRIYRAYAASKKEREKYLRLRKACIIGQARFREFKEARRLRIRYLQLRNITISIQRRVRANNAIQEKRRTEAATKIKAWYVSVKITRECRMKFLNLKKSIITIQSFLRMYIHRKRFVALKTAVTIVQRFYRSYRLTKSYREQYVSMKTSVIKFQSYVRCFIERKRYLKLRSATLVIQTAFRLKRTRDMLKRKREEAAICLQKNIRRYLVQSRYCRYKNQVTYIQNLWRRKLITRLLRCEYLQKRNMLIKLQARIRGYLVRKQMEHKRELLLKIREEQRQNWAASKIQALFRGNKARMASDCRVEELRRRWRDGGLQSSQKMLSERNEDALEVLSSVADIESVIRAFQSIELLTEVFPMMYDSNAASVVRRIYVYMSVTNRSISSIEVLKSGASILVNLTRYRVTGPKIYARERITPILKFMWRFSNSETYLFCKLATYLFLFSKYETVKKDLTEFLHSPDNHKILVTIKGNINRMKRMTCNRNKFNTPQPSKFVSHTINQSLRDSLNHSECSNSSNGSVLFPALEPDYGIVRLDKPRYFEDAQQAITCLFSIYKL